MQNISLFLGANSESGFASLYSQLLSGRFEDLLILKGGPGCGKSTFMRTLSHDLSKTEERQILVPCSGDPDSLDAVLFPALRVGAVDGTPPHALEPSYAIVCERTVDLSRFYNTEAVKEHRAEVILLSDAYRARYRDAYRALSACGVLKRQIREIALGVADFEKLTARMDGILAKELPGRAGKRGSADECFLGGLTHKGEVCCFDTVSALCPRIYVLKDGCGIGSPLLEVVMERAIESGERMLLCRDADDPARLRHLLLPNRGIAFVTDNALLPYPHKVYRHLLLDAAFQKSLTRTEKAKLRFLQRLERELRKEAQKKLGEAKSAHDALERLYHPYVDFGGVIALAHEQAAMLKLAKT